MRHSGQVAHSRLEPHSSGNRRNERSAATADPVPLEQGDAELPLQHPDLLAQRRLRDAEPLGGAGEVQLSSMGGQMSFAGFSAYSATKFALEGWSEARADEVRPFGVDVLIVEPGAFRTGLFDPARLTTSADGGAYAGSVGGARTMVAGGDDSQASDPDKLARLIIDVLGSGRVPLRLPVGSDAINAILTTSTPSAPTSTPSAPTSTPGPPPPAPPPSTPYPPWTPHPPPPTRDNRYRRRPADLGAPLRDPRDVDIAGDAHRPKCGEASRPGAAILRIGRCACSSHLTRPAAPRDHPGEQPKASQCRRT